MSGRQLTISDTVLSDLSVVEVNQIQRVAIARLQGMDIGVSFGLLKGTRIVWAIFIYIIHPSVL